MNIQTLEHWVDANINSMSGGAKKPLKKAPKKTNETILHKGRKRVVYVGTNGGKYIKTSKDGVTKYISLPKK